MTDYRGAESLLVDAWLQATLAGDTGPGGVAALVGGRIYGAAPRGSAYPLVWHQCQSPPQDITEVGARLIAADGLWLVRVVGQVRDFGPLISVASRIYTLLHGQQVSVSGGRVLACTRERAFRLEEEVNGVSYRHLGHLFRCLAQPEGV